MPEISSIGRGSIGPIERPVASSAHGRQTIERLGNHTAMKADRVELSQQTHHARLVEQLREMPDVRADRVAEVRRALAQGVYESDAKLEVALDRVLSELNP